MSTPAHHAPSALPLLLLVQGAVVAGLPLLGSAPNRLLSGKGVSLAQVLAGVGPAWTLLAGVLAVTWFTLLVGLLARPAHRLWPLATLPWLAAATGGLAALAGQYATAQAAATDGLGRVAPGSAWWLGLLLAWLAANEALRRLQASSRQRVLYSALLLGGLVWLLASGSLDALSSLKEYANRQEDFWRALGQHLRVIALTAALTLVLGLPLGVALHHRPRWATRVFPVLNLVQTIPSIALFGMLMALLAWLGTLLPLLPRWGIQGIGLAPAVLALTAYSLLPLVRSTYEGLASVTHAVKEAGQAMGLSPRQVLWQVELPLAAPVLLSGLKVMLVQTIGLTAVAALIGAGGLGTLMFEGLFSSAVDLVVLAVVPIIVLAWCTEALFAVSQATLLPLHGTRT